MTEVITQSQESGRLSSVVRGGGFLRLSPLDPTPNNPLTLTNCSLEIKPFPSQSLCGWVGGQAGEEFPGAVVWPPVSGHTAAGSEQQSPRGAPWRALDSLGNCSIQVRPGAFRAQKRGYVDAGEVLSFRHTGAKPTRQIGKTRLQ